MELGSKSQNRDGLLGPKAIMAVYMNPLGYECTVWVMDPRGMLLSQTQAPTNWVFAQRAQYP